MKWIRARCRAGERAKQRREQHSRPVEVSWAQLVAGLIALGLTATAGFCFVKAMTVSSPRWWVWGSAGALSLTLGAFVLLAALYGRISLLDLTAVPRSALRSYPAERQAAPLLGELLMEWKAINEQQLEAALKWQERHGGKLGEALVNLGIVTPEDLEQVLKTQLGLADPWRRP